MTDGEMENKKEKSYKINELDDFSGICKTEKAVEEATEDFFADSVEESQSNAILPFGKRKVICIALSVVVLLVVLFGVYGAFVPQDRIIGGLTVNGINIGGMREDEAVLSLAKSNPKLKDEVVINANGKRFVVRADEIDAMLDIAATAHKAYNIAKGGNIFLNGADSLKIKLSGGKILPVITFDEEKFAQIINEIGIEALGSQLIEHSVRFEDGKGYMVPGTSGYNNDPLPVMEMIKQALLNSKSEDIDVEFIKTKPQDMTVEMLDSYVFKEPVNVSFALENGEVKIVEAVEGRYIEKDECKALVSKVKEGGTEIEFPYYVTAPEFDSKDVKGKLFNGELASYSTRYAPGGNRGSNVAIAASKINGKILLPGETFSFNRTVGKRTVANGFKPAPEYQSGKTVTGIGGGTCQVSTTVYSAALYADLKIVKRSNHSMSVSYVPLGQDATVTDGGLDLKFMNDTEYPIKILAVTNGGKITVTIIGTKPQTEKTVKINHKSTGSGIRTTRYVYDNLGNLIKEEDMGLSKYKPHESEDGDSTPSPSPTPKAEEMPVAPYPVATEIPEKTPAITEATTSTEAPAHTSAPVVQEVLETKSPVSDNEKNTAPTFNNGGASTPMKSEE